jgi:hypothetical protein
MVERARIYNGIVQLEHHEKNLLGLMADTLGKNFEGGVGVPR